MTPEGTTRTLIEADELAGARAWAERHSICIEWRSELLELRVPLAQPSETAEDPSGADRFYLLGRFTGYPAHAPEWSFTTADWQEFGELRLYPKPIVPFPYGNAMFLNYGGKPVICAPFNRLAFGDRSGPHPDWGPPENWLAAAPEYVTAQTLGDMLQAIYRDFLFTEGRLP